MTRRNPQDRDGDRPRVGRRSSREERGSRIILYTCPWQKRSSAWHPCGVAAKALDTAGYSYEIKEVRGQLSMPWTWLSRRRDRADVRSLSGQNGIPILLLADGSVIAGSSRIARWAKEHPVPRGAEGKRPTDPASRKKRYGPLQLRYWLGLGLVLPTLQKREETLRMAEVAQGPRATPMAGS